MFILNYTYLYNWNVIMLTYKNDDKNMHIFINVQI